MPPVKNCPKCRAGNSYVWNKEEKVWRCRLCGFSSPENPPTEQKRLFSE